jgi:hypothetical protein
MSISIPLRTFCALIAIAASQTACSSIDDTSSVGMAPAQCRAAGARQFLGQQYEPRLADEARAYAGAMRSRVIMPGQVVTRSEPDPLRLNVEVDGRGRIHRLRCG